MQHLAAFAHAGLIESQAATLKRGLEALQAFVHHRTVEQELQARLAMAYPMFSNPAVGA